MLQKPIQASLLAAGAEAHNFTRLPRGPERLIGMGFRCWLAGFQSGDIQCWELAWKHYAEELGAQCAKTIVSDLSVWVRAVRNAAAREIEVYPAGCSGFCRDECMAIAMVAAAQQNACPALKACAFALLETDELDDVVDMTSTFANTLQTEGIVLSANSLALSPAIDPGMRSQPH